MFNKEKKNQDQGNGLGDACELLHYCPLPVWTRMLTLGAELNHCEHGGLVHCSHVGKSCYHGAKRQYYIFL